LCNVTLPWALRIANRGILGAAQEWPPVARAINVHQGELTNPMVANAFNMQYAARFEQ
jgi:alanine dehydrogenase